MLCLGEVQLFIFVYLSMLHLFKVSKNLKSHLLNLVKVKNKDIRTILIASFMCLFR